jgi:hypothetical protein
MAKGEWLWYLDCDSLILDNKQILKTYIKNARQDSILSGGRVYQPEPPKEKSKQLHWKWGYQRELSDPVLRMRDPVNHFLSNNFFLHKSIFNKIRFDIQLLGYGYEDTLFAAEAVHCGFRIIHILNSVLHNGLEPTDVFLNKIEQSLDNLIRLRDVCREKKIKFPVKSKLILAYKVLSLPVLFQLFGKWFIRNEKLWKVQLRQSNPSLQIFDAWRLARLLNS